MMERTPQLQWYESVRKSASRRFPKLLVLPHDLGGWRFQGVMGQLQATLNSDSLVIASECLYFLQNQITSDMQAIYLLIILLIPIVYYNIHTCKSLTIQHGTLILNLGMPSNPLPEHRTCLSRPYIHKDSSIQQYWPTGRVKIGDHTFFRKPSFFHLHHKQRLWQTELENYLGSTICTGTWLGFDEYDMQRVMDKLLWLLKQFETYIYYLISASSRLAPAKCFNTTSPTTMLW